MNFKIVISVRGIALLTARPDLALCSLVAPYLESWLRLASIYKEEVHF